jgi:hypothetical protein
LLMPCVKPAISITAVRPIALDTPAMLPLCLCLLFG